MTKIPHVALILGAALLALAACQSGGQGDASDQAQGTGELPKPDAAFIDTVGPLGIAEVRLAQLASEKATDPAVREFAAKIIAEHTAINQQLAALADSKGTQAASDMDGRDAGTYGHLESMTGLAFGRIYMNSQLEDLTMLIQAFQNESDSGKDPQVRGFAGQHLPMLQQQLQMALKVAPLGV